MNNTHDNPIENQAEKDRLADIEQARTDCMEQLDFCRGLFGLLVFRFDNAVVGGEGLDCRETADIEGTLRGGYEAATKAWRELSELGDLRRALKAGGEQ